VGAGLAGLQQPTSESTSSDSTDDAFARLSKFKQMLDGGLITQEDYDEAKRQALGL
jgi:hypothetical protein